MIPTITTIDAENRRDTIEVYFSGPMRTGWTRRITLHTRPDERFVRIADRSPDRLISSALTIGYDQAPLVEQAIQIARSMTADGTQRVGNLQRQIKSVGISADRWKGEPGMVFSFGPGRFKGLHGNEFSALALAIADLLKEGH